MRENCILDLSIDFCVLEIYFNRYFALDIFVQAYQALIIPCSLVLYRTLGYGRQQRSCHDMSSSLGISVDQGLPHDK